MEYKKLLKAISRGDYEFDKVDNVDKIIDYMLDNIGNLDSKLRDDLIYSTFSKIITNSQISDEKLKWLISKIIDKRHLFYHINDNDKTSVFTRSFSVLVVACALFRHRKQTLFTKDELTNIFNKVIEYCKLENDYRGYVDVYGWAHSTAHIADALNQLAMCDEFKKNKLKIILSMVKRRVCIGTYTYIHEEDERLVTAVINIINRNEFSIDEIKKWISSFGEVTPINDYMMNYSMKLNIKNFLRSLYFRLYSKNKMNELQSIIVNILDEL